MSSSDNGIKLNDSSSRLWRPRGLSSLVVSSAFRLVAIMIQYDYRQVPKLYYFPPPILSFHAKGNHAAATGVLSMRNASNTRRQTRVHQAWRADGAHFLPPLCVRCHGIIRSLIFLGGRIAKKVVPALAYSTRSCYSSSNPAHSLYFYYIVGG
jgi:hypothetical protein